MLAGFPLFVVLAACGGGNGVDGPSRQAAAATWQPVLTPQDVEIVQRTFPRFRPELFGPATSGSAQTPENFLPATFFGEASTQPAKLTPYGISVSTGGFDALDHPEFLPSEGTYFDRQRNPYTFSLGIVSFCPLWNLESRMGFANTPGAALIEVDRRKSRLDLGEIDRIMLDVRDAVAVRLPAAAAVDPRKAQIVFEPAIFYVRGSNFGDTWAGGQVQPLGNNTYRIRLLFFYINSQRRVMDWREYLIHEAINFYVISVGRSDLAI